VGHGAGEPLDVLVLACYGERLGSVLSACLVDPSARTRRGQRSQRVGWQTQIGVLARR
jgi:hypothetical protein